MDQSEARAITMASLMRIDKILSLASVQIQAERDKVREQFKQIQGEMKNRQSIPIDLVFEIICETLKLEKDKVRSKKRKRELVDARFIGIGYIREKMPAIIEEKIGEYLSGRDHSTISAANQQHQDLMIANNSYFNKASECFIAIENRLNGETI
jgi:chromosomal replication initiation ATPase DnaA